MSWKSILGKIAPIAAMGASFIPGIGPIIGKGLSAAGGIGNKVVGALPTLSGQGGGDPSQLGKQSFLDQFGNVIASTGLGVLGNVLNARAANQPEKWRQGIVEDELARRDAFAQAGMPSLVGALGYRSPTSPAAQAAFGPAQAVLGKKKK